jgi:hypothetical protein
MEFGIFRGGSASVGRLIVNGVYRQDIAPNQNINIADMLADPRDMKIRRNQFHRIEIQPIATEANPLGLTRIVANVFLQIFTNSRGSGDY